MKINGLRWYIAALLFTATVINYVDRQALSIAAPVLTKELNLSPVEYANILQAFLYAYTVMYLVSGILVDKWGTRLSVSVFMVWWSASNVLHAFARTAFQLGFFRFLLGVGEPGNFMAATKATSEWYPPGERGFVNGLVNAGAAVGAIISAPLVVWIYVHYGWRSAFVITGCLGFVWLIAWLALYRSPEHHPFITSQELALVKAESAAAAVPAQGRTRWVDLLKLPETWGLFLSRFISDPVWWFYLFWLPKYLVEQRGFTMVEMGMLAWLPYLTADLGSILGGLASGWLIRRKWEIVSSRLACMAFFASLMPLSVVIAFTDSIPIAMTVICIVTFGHMGWKTNQMTLTNDLYPKQVVGSISGMFSFGNGLGGALFTGATGLLVQHFGYSTVFVILGFLHPLSFVIIRSLIKPPQPSPVLAVR